MVQCQAQMEELVLKRGAVPRSVLTAGLQEAVDMNIATAIEEVSIHDLEEAGPGTARASHRIAKFHTPNWQRGRKDPVRSSTVSFWSTQLSGLVVLCIIASAPEHSCQQCLDPLAPVSYAYGAAWDVLARPL